MWSIKEKMLSLARSVDRGRLLVGLMIVAPLGAMISVPSGPAQSVSAQWEVTRSVNAAVGANPLTAPSPTAAQILAQVSSPSEPAQAGSPITVSSDLVTEGGELDVSQPLAGFIPGTPPDAKLAATLRLAQSRFTPQQSAQTSDPSARAIALASNSHVIFTRQSQVSDLTSGLVDPRVVDLLTWAAGRRQSITVSALRSDHQMCVRGTSPCRVSAHFSGRALDIAAVNGQACTGTPVTECGRLYEEMVSTVRGTPYQPSQVIHGYDLWPTEPWNFALGDHRDHIHIGF